jgi:hypothetical protein
MGGAAEIVAPQFEQNRALCGNPVPHRLQNTAMVDPSQRTFIHCLHTEKNLQRFH